MRTTLLAVLLSSTALTAAAQDFVTIGQTTALVPEASVADTPDEAAVDGASGDTAFPYLTGVKALATMGEVDPETGAALTGYPDGHAAWLADQDTVRVAYQSESYGTMSSETYPWTMASGATFTGSHIHTIDYDRAAMADFQSNDSAASEMFKGSGNLFDTVYNVFGDVVQPRADGGVWGNQARPDGTLIPFDAKMALSEADFFFQSFCGAYYEPANKYGDGVGLADDIWFTAEEWNIQRMFDNTDSEGAVVSSNADAHDTMGLASIAVDIASGTAYTVPALGQTGYEKILPINPGHPDYVVMVLAGYNHDVEPAPLKIYVGMKGRDASGASLAADAPARDQFLAHNGMLYGKIYGLAAANDTFADLGIDNIDLAAKMMDAYVTDADATDSFDAVFAPTSYQWGGWDSPVAVRNTEMLLWGDSAEQPEGHTFLVGDSKTEHPAVDPDITKSRWIQNMTQEGAMLGLDLGDLGRQLSDAEGNLPATLDVSVTRTVAAVDGSVTLDVADKGVKPGDNGTHATWEDGSAKMVAPDGLQWIMASDANVLIVDEDSGNEMGERKYAFVIDPQTLTLREDGKGYFLASAGGALNPRAENGTSVMGGTFSDATSSEFSGSWNVSALIARKDDGSFYTMDDLAGTGQQQIIGSLPLADQTLIGVVQHKGESGGQVEAVQADQGGQLFIFKLNLPEGSYQSAAAQ